MNGEFVQLVILRGDKASGKRDTREDMKAPGKRWVAAGLVFRIQRGARGKLFTVATVEKNERKRGETGGKGRGKQDEREQKENTEETKEWSKESEGQTGQKGRVFFPVTRLSR